MKTIKLNTMRKLILSTALMAASFTTFAQVGVGTTTPKGALQVSSTTSGVIIPQFADLTAIQAIKKTDGTTALNSEEQGMQVYNIAEKKIYMWDGTTWNVISGGEAKWIDAPLNGAILKISPKGFNNATDTLAIAQGSNYVNLSVYSKTKGSALTATSGSGYSVTLMVV